MSPESDTHVRPLTVLMADDDEDDRDFTRDALAGTSFVEAMQFVADGRELIDYLHEVSPHAAPGSGRHPRPSIILLDLNMPRMDGREALAEIKADADLRSIPVIVLTTSSDDEDVRRVYDLGAASFITKPVTGSKLRFALTRLAEYWSQIVALPDPAFG